MVPIKYQLSQICVYPDREAAALAVKERLLSLRERIINGEKFATLARIYSEDPGSARRGGDARGACMSGGRIGSDGMRGMGVAPLVDFLVGAEPGDKHRKERRYRGNDASSACARE